eukprot:3685957-Amphidinium_carterae.1
MQQAPSTPQSARPASGSEVPPPGREMNVDGQHDVRQEEGEQAIVAIGTTRDLTPRIARGIDDSDMLSPSSLVRQLYLPVVFTIHGRIQTHERQAQADLTVSREVYLQQTRLRPVAGSTEDRYLTEVRSLNAQFRHSEAAHIR